MTDGYATFEMIEQSLPFYMRGHYTLASFKRQRHYAKNFLPFYRSSKHHAPPHWRVADLVEWLSRAFPHLPARDAATFAENLRAVALKDPPLTPVKESRAGRPPKWKKRRKAKK
jgi:hypothetical protein